MSEGDEHISVMLAEAIEGLRVKPEGIYLDGTFGRGGHSGAILRTLGPLGRLYAMDKDPRAIESARRQYGAEPRFQIQQGSFAMMEAQAKAWDITGRVDGILLDLGVSSPQIDDATRGFSFRQDGPLDMRMDPTHGQSAAQRLATVSEQDLADVLFHYGEERYSRRIAKAIVAERAQSAIETTLQLAEIIAKAHPKWERDRHPATRCFQAIRIWVNEELDDITTCLRGVPALLAPGGRLAVISFHSLEDKLVKEQIQEWEHPQAKLPAGLPVRHDDYPSVMRHIGKMRPPSEEETARNPRARSARLRVAEKVRAPSDIRSSR